MTSQDDWYAKRRDEIRAKEAALDEELAREAAQPVVARRQGSALRSALFLVAILVLGIGLTGLGVTLSRLAGESMDDATRTGQATVTSCQQHGPVGNKGFGYWYGCVATITWADGENARVSVPAVFTSADVGKTIEVGDAGRDRQTQKLARADVDGRPWLRWVGIVIGVAGVLPLILAVFIIRELFRRKR